MKIILPALAIAAAICIPVSPALAQPAAGHVLLCGYFDFNHDIGYTSHPFSVNDDTSSPDVRNAYLAPFVAAIKTQYHVTVDLRHVWCDEVGPWRVAAERSRDAAYSQDPALMPANERRVDWPAGA